jgi:hypothetical protein
VLGTFDDVDEKLVMPVDVDEMIAPVDPMLVPVELSEPLLDPCMVE